MTVTALDEENLLLKEMVLFVVDAYPPCSMKPSLQTLYQFEPDR